MIADQGAGRGRVVGDRIIGQRRDLVAQGVLQQVAAGREIGDRDRVGAEGWLGERQPDRLARYLDRVDGQAEIIGDHVKGQSPGNRGRLQMFVECEHQVRAVDLRAHQRRGDRLRDRSAPDFSEECEPTPQGPGAHPCPCVGAIEAPTSSGAVGGGGSGTGQSVMGVVGARAFKDDEVLGFRFENRIVRRVDLFASQSDSGCAPREEGGARSSIGGNGVNRDGRAARAGMAVVVERDPREGVARAARTGRELLSCLVVCRGPNLIAVGGRPVTGPIEDAR